MQWNTNRLEADDGAVINLYHARPDTAPKAVLQVNHGMAEHGARYHEFAHALIDAGFGVYVHDHRGHGQTTAPDTSLGIFARKNGWQRVMQDVALVHTRINEDHPDCPVICFGHSMGAIIGFNHILRHPDRVAGAVLWNSGVETGLLASVFSRILRVQRMFKGSDVPSGLAQKATFEAWNQRFSPNRTPFDWLSRDPVEVDKYVADPLCGFPVSIGLWLDLLEGIYFAADDDNLKGLPADMPIHLLAGENDPCSEYGKAVSNIADRMKRQDMKDVTLSILPETRHECLHEINRDETTRELISWLNARYTPQ